MAFVFGCQIPTQHFRTQLFQFVAFGWFEFRILAEQDRIAAAFETCQIVQRNGGRFAYGDFAAGLPMPWIADGAKSFLQRLAIDEYLKLSWRSGSFPWRDPVTRANPNLVLSCFGKVDRTTGIGNRFAQSMSQQIGRPHQIHELLINNPTAFFGERFNFDQDHVVVCANRSWAEANCEEHENQNLTCHQWTPFFGSRIVQNNVEH